MDLATSVQAGLVLEQTGLVQAVLMQACLGAARNVVRRALHAAFDVAPCRTSVPERRWLEPRSPTQPRIPEKKRSFGGGYSLTTLIQIKDRRSGQTSSVHLNPLVFDLFGPSRKQQLANAR